MEANTNYVSPTVERITGYPPHVWMKQRDWFITDAAINKGAKEATAAHLRGEASDGPMILEVQHREGHHILLEVYEHPSVRDGRVVGLQGVAHDVTDRKRAEEEIVRSLREKEVLLKEIHHRVKNNLQVISSMLSMQALEAAEQPVREALVEAQSRVRSMALVHEKLYTVTDFARVDLHQYAANLAANLAGSWMRPEIDLSVEGSETFVGVDTAIPCGLILNELITNALKHAFAGRERGSIRVSVHPRENAEVVLGVEDDGIGFPEDREFKTVGSMGMNLVLDLVDQLSGSISLDGTNGTHIVIRFRR
jgi:PAS domain S-box-containing protein